MQRTQQGSKSDSSRTLPQAGPSGRYTFQKDASDLPPAGLPCLPDRRLCSRWMLLLLLGVSTALLLLELASRPLFARHWSGACGKACLQLRHAKVRGSPAPSSRNKYSCCPLVAMSPMLTYVFQNGSQETKHELLLRKMGYQGCMAWP